MNHNKECMENFRYLIKKAMSLWLLVAGIHVFGIAIALYEKNTIDGLAYISLISCAVFATLKRIR